MVRRVEPVVVSPDMHSKNASVKLMCSLRISGSVATADTATQLTVVMRNASRTVMLRSRRQPTMTAEPPKKADTAAETMKGNASPGSSVKLAQAGISMLIAKATSIMPTTNSTGRKLGMDVDP